MSTMTPLLHSQLNEPWLKQQPGMIPWEDGCARLEACLAHWVETYSETLCESSVTEAHEEYPDYATRVWECWKHHWQDAIHASDMEAVDGETVLRSLQAGRGYRHGGSLQGDPLQDVVLAYAFLLSENRAIVQFQADYESFARQLVRKRQQRLGNDAEDWWNEFLDFLGGFTKSPGKLIKFKGKSSLKHWLRTTVWNFVRRRSLPETYDNPDCQDTQPDATVQLMQQELFQKFRIILLAEMKEFSREDLLLLYYLYVKKLKQNEVARILGSDTSTISRRIKRIYARLKEIARKCEAEEDLRIYFQAVLEAIMTLGVLIKQEEDEV